jgi:hypothetical protein
MYDVFQETRPLDQTDATIPHIREATGLLTSYSYCTAAETHFSFILDSQQRLSIYN